MEEEMTRITTMLTNDVVSVNAYKKFLEATDRLRYFGYVDKKELKRLCRTFNYTDTISFVKGGITAAVIIGLISVIRKSEKAKNDEEVIEVEAEVENIE